MSAENFDECFVFYLNVEGGFVDDPLDPGGATNMGITIGLMRKLGLDVNGDGVVDVRDVQSIPKATVKAVVRGQFWNAVQGDFLPNGLDLVALDGAVNSGPVSGAKWLQEALGVTADGYIGPQTLAAAHATGLNIPQVIDAACDARMSFLQSLPGWAHDGKGWTNRVSSLRTVAKNMYAKSTASPAVVATPSGATPPPPAAPKPFTLDWFLKQTGLDHVSL